MDAQPRERLAVHQPEPEIGRAPANRFIDRERQLSMILSRTLKAGDLQPRLRKRELGESATPCLESVYDSKLMLYT